jgi:hypothetical protein
MVATVMLGKFWLGGFLNRQVAKTPRFSVRVWEPTHSVW